MSDKIVPLISSGTKGPLGVIHLPRLWQKVSLEAAGKIADGYPGIGAGYDAMVIAGLGLDTEAVRAHITNDKPTYPQFEAWVKSQEGAKLDDASISELTASIVIQYQLLVSFYALKKDVTNLFSYIDHISMIYLNNPTKTRTGRISESDKYFDILIYQ